MKARRPVQVPFRKGIVLLDAELRGEKLPNNDCQPAPASRHASSSVNGAANGHCVLATECFSTGAACEREQQHRRDDSAAVHAYV